MLGLNMFMLMLQSMPDGGQSSPTPESPIVQTTVGLSVAGVLLSGFLILIALMIFVPLAASWYREKTLEHHHVH